MRKSAKSHLWQLENKAQGPRRTPRLAHLTFSASFLLLLNARPGKCILLDTPPQYQSRKLKHCKISCPTRQPIQNKAQNWTPGLAHPTFSAQTTAAWEQVDRPLQFRSGIIWRIDIGQVLNDSEERFQPIRVVSHTGPCCLEPGNTLKSIRLIKAWTPAFILRSSVVLSLICTLSQILGCQSLFSGDGVPPTLHIEIHCNTLAVRQLRTARPGS